MRVWYSMTLSRCCPMDSISREKRVICSSCTASKIRKGEDEASSRFGRTPFPKTGVLKKIAVHTREQNASERLNDPSQHAWTPSTVDLGGLAAFRLDVG